MIRIFDSAKGIPYTFINSEMLFKFRSMELNFILIFSKSFRDENGE